MQKKIVPDCVLILMNNPKQSLHARNSFENEIFWKRIIKKSLKSYLYLFFWTQSLLMDKIIQNKRDLELATRCSSSYEASSEMSFVMYYLTKCDDVKQFLSYSNNYIYKFMQCSSWHHKLFHFHLSFWIWEVWKRREKQQNLNILRTKKAF